MYIKKGQFKVQPSTLSHCPFLFAPTPLTRKPSSLCFYKALCTCRRHWAISTRVPISSTVCTTFSSSVSCSGHLVSSSSPTNLSSCVYVMQNQINITKWLFFFIDCLVLTLKQNAFITMMVGLTPSNTKLIKSNKTKFLLIYSSKLIFLIKLRGIKLTLPSSLIVQ